MIYIQNKLIVILSLVATGVLSTPANQTNPDSDTKTEHQSLLDTCHLPADQGPCDGAFPRWHYNCSIGSCEKFSYGGCEGNENNHRSKEDCEYSCFGTCSKRLPHGSSHHEDGGGIGLGSFLRLGFLARLFGAGSSQGQEHRHSLLPSGQVDHGDIMSMRPNPGIDTAHETSTIDIHGTRSTVSGRNSGHTSNVKVKQPTHESVASPSSTAHESLARKDSISSIDSHGSHSSSGDHESHASLSSHPSSTSSSSHSSSASHPSSSSHSTTSDHSNHPSSSSHSISSDHSSHPSSSSSSTRKTSSSSSSHPSSSSHHSSSSHSSIHSSSHGSSSKKSG